MKAIKELMNERTLNSYLIKNLLIICPSYNNCRKQTILQNMINTCSNHIFNILKICSKYLQIIFKIFSKHFLEEVGPWRPAGGAFPRKNKRF